MASVHTNFSEEASTIEEDEFPIRILLEVYTLLAIICVAANILIIFVIVKYKRLRREKWNILILNWAAVNCLYMLSSPISFRLMVDLWHLVKSTRTLCFMQEIEQSLLLVDTILIIILTLYWYLKLYHHEKYLKLDQHVRCILIFVYVFFLFCAGLNIDNCYNSRYPFLGELIICFAYLVFMVFMIIINILHAIRKRRLVEYSDRKNIPFILSNTLFLSYLPLLLAFFSPLFGMIAHQVIAVICLLIAVLNPFYFFVILYYCNTDYNTFFRHLFSCKCREYSDELEEQPVSYNNGIENTY